jgi:hypothetical protein
MECARAYYATGAGGRGWPCVGATPAPGGGRCAGGGAGLGAGSADVPRSQVLVRRCLGGRATLRGSGCGHQTEPEPRL